MRYFNKDFKPIECPYGINFLDRYLTFNKSVTIVPLGEYQPDYNTDIVLTYEWSGLTKVPSALHSNHYVLHFDFMNNSSNVIYYPHWLFFVAELQKKFSDVNTTHPIACASRNFNNNRPAKIYNYQQLKNKEYFERLLITKYKSIEEFDTEIIKNDIPTAMIDEFLMDYITWPVMIGNDLDLINSMGIIDIPVYKESLFHLIAETTVNHYALSEKSFKTFLSGQIPIMCGPQYAVKHLRDLGFDVFDDIIDHNRYDNINDWKQRIDMMHTCIDDIVNLDHNSIKDETLARRINNFNHLKSTEFHKSILEPIARRIS